MSTGHAGVAAPQQRSGYMRDNGAGVFVNYLPALREPRDEIRLSQQAAAARAIDLSHNNGFIAGGIDQATAFTVGAGLNINSTPDGAALGWTSERTRTWARSVERAFELWAGNAGECDSEGRAPLHKLVKGALRSWYGTGEILGQIGYERLPGARFGTKLRILPSTRLVQHTGDGWFQGVRLSATGRPLAYRLRVVDEGRNHGSHGTVDVAASDRFGRARIVHVFDGGPGQVRGITPMAPVLPTARQFDQLNNATLTAAIIQAANVATVTSDVPTAEVMEAFRSEFDGKGGPEGVDPYTFARGQFHTGANVDIGRFGKISHLMSGEKFEFHGSKHPNDTYEAFVATLLREIARCIGITYEDMTGDYRGATYSSVRAAVAATWIITMIRRSFLAAPVYQAGYEAWMEEAIDIGAVEVPGVGSGPRGVAFFLQNRAALTRARWRGLGRPQPDDLKTAKAHALWKQIGVMTDEMIANELGVDIEDVYEQLEREREMRQQRKLPDTSLVGVSGDLLQAEDRENPDGSLA